VQPPWATAVPQIDVWTTVLHRDFGCDMLSIQELFCLAQHSTEGYQAANTVVSKILKKKADRCMLDNPSGFLHNNVLKARQRITPDYRASA
jgi:hypothetical protein